MERPSVDIVVDVRAVAKDLLEKYGSRKNISHNSKELIQRYGQMVYSQILQAAISIQRDNLRALNSKRQTSTPTSLKKQVKQPSFYNKYIKKERYTFVSTGKVDSRGRQFLKDEDNHLFLLTDPNVHYEAGTKVRCTVKGLPTIPGEMGFVLLSEPRKITVESITVRVPKRPEFRFSEVQDLGRHKCGKPFKCSCCGRNFPAYAGWRVELKELYFCNACASQIYMPKERGNHHFYITTPMGNKR